MKGRGSLGRKEMAKKMKNLPWSLLILTVCCFWAEKSDYSFLASGTFLGVSPSLC